MSVGGVGRSQGPRLPDEPEADAPTTHDLLREIGAQAREIEQRAESWQGDAMTQILAKELAKFAHLIEEEAAQVEAALAPAPADAAPAPAAGAAEAPPAQHAVTEAAAHPPAPAPAPAPAQTRPPPPARETYAVRPGDNMTRIARDHGVSVQDLERANPQVANPSLIHPGEVLTIPGHGGPAPAPAPAPTPAPAPPPPAPSSDYTVRQGDSLSAIAASHGVSLAALEAANPQIGNPNLIHPGEAIHIPGGGAGNTRGAGGPGGPGPVSGPAPAGSVAANVLRWKSDILAASSRHGVPPALIAAIIQWESGGNPNALSFDGGHGKGLMQVDDRWHAFARGPNALDPAANVDYGTSVLAGDLGAFHGNLRAGIAAYNAGVGGVQGALARGEDPSAATYSRGYVDAIISSMQQYQRYF